jgi:hypothetical protein
MPEPARFASSRSSAIPFCGVRRLLQPRVCRCHGATLIHLAGKNWKNVNRVPGFMSSTPDVVDGGIDVKRELARKAFV